MPNRRNFLRLSLGVLALPACSLQPHASAPSVRNFDRLSPRSTRAWSIRQALSHQESSAAHQPFPWFSITKIFATLSLASHLSSHSHSLDAPLTGIFPEWRRDPRKSRITLRHLVTQTAGLPSGAPQLYRRRPSSVGSAALALPSTHSPGQTFTYGPACWEILGEFLARSQSTSLVSLLQQITSRQHGPIHFTRTDANGTPYLSTGIEASAATLSRLGQTLNSLLLGRSASGIDAKIFQQLVRPSSANPIFAGGLWFNRLATRSAAAEVSIEDALESSSSPRWSQACLSRRQPPALTALIGSYGQRLYLLPDQRLSIARLGSSSGWNDAAFLRSF